MTHRNTAIQATGQKRSQPKVTCATCNLKRCVGRCQWKALDRPEPAKCG